MCGRRITWYNDCHWFNHVTYWNHKPHNNYKYHSTGCDVLSMLLAFFIFNRVPLAQPLVQRIAALPIEVLAVGLFSNVGSHICLHTHMHHICLRSWEMAAV